MPNIKYSNPIDVVTFKVFGLFDAFRGNPKLNNLEDSVHIVLLLVSLYKDGVINENSFSNELDISKLKVLVIESQLTNKVKETYLLIIDEISNSLYSLFSQSLNYLSFHLFQLDREKLNQNFPEVFDTLLFKLSEAQGKQTSKFI